RRDGANGVLEEPEADGGGAVVGKAVSAVVNVLAAAGEVIGGVGVGDFVLVRHRARGVTPVGDVEVVLRAPRGESGGPARVYDDPGVGERSAAGAGPRRHGGGTGAAGRRAEDIVPVIARHRGSIDGVLVEFKKGGVDRRRQAILEPFQVNGMTEPRLLAL